MKQIYYSSSFFVVVGWTSGLRNAWLFSVFKRAISISRLFCELIWSLYYGYGFVRFDCWASLVWPRDIVHSTIRKNTSFIMWVCIQINFLLCNWWVKACGRALFLYLSGIGHVCVGWRINHWRMDEMIGGKWSAYWPALFKYWDLVLGRQYIIKHQRSCSSLKLYWEQVMYRQLRNSVRYTWAVNCMTVLWSLFLTSLRCTCASHLRSQHSGSWGRKIAFEFETTFDYSVKPSLKTKEKAQN